LKFLKVGALWNSKKQDRHGKPYMNGIIDIDMALKKGMKVFVFQVAERKKATSPVATLSIGYEEEPVPVAPEVEEEPLPEPLPDEPPPTGGEWKDPF
jgi:hypothetical protein